MADIKGKAVLRVKRGLSADFASVQLLEGELGYVEDTKELYIGTATGNELFALVDNPTLLKVGDNVSELINDSNYIAVGDTITIDGGTF